MGKTEGHQGNRRAIHTNNCFPMSHTTLEGPKKHLSRSKRAHSRGEMAKAIDHPDDYDQRSGDAPSSFKSISGLYFTNDR